MEQFRRTQRRPKGGREVLRTQAQRGREREDSATGEPTRVSIRLNGNSGTFLVVTDVTEIVHMGEAGFKIDVVTHPVLLTQRHLLFEQLISWELRSALQSTSGTHHGLLPSSHWPAMLLLSSQKLALSILS
jgi:hypothetical protein